MAYHEFLYEKEVCENMMPVVSVILPVCHAVRSLSETIESVLKQDFDAWELIIVCRQDISDGDARLIRHYAGLDERIRVIENPHPPGLAHALNVGLGQAKGKYIAIIQGGDVSDARRLGVQVAYMERKPDVGVTHFFQRYFGAGENNFVHRPPVSAEAMKAKLLFFCEVCLSTVMIRRSVMDERQLLFNPDARFPDYEFWTRMVQVTAFETIPKIYGARHMDDAPFPTGGDGAEETEICEMTARQLKENLELEIPPEKRYLLGELENVFSNMGEAGKREALSELTDILFEIWKANLLIRHYSSEKLVMAISAKWRWAKYNEPWQGERKVFGIGQALELWDSREWKNVLFNHVIQKPYSMVRKVRARLDEKKTEYLADMIHSASED